MSNTGVDINIRYRIETLLAAVYTIYIVVRWGKVGWEEGRVHPSTLRSHKKEWTGGKSTLHH